MISIPKVLENKLTRPVAVFGGGISGNAVARFLSEQNIPVVVYDKSGMNGACKTFTDETAAQHDLVVHSPGFPPTHPWMQLARTAGSLCLTEIDFAATFWQGSALPARIFPGENTQHFLARIGNRQNLTTVTGTNGKTTLTEFLSFAHRKAGRGAIAVGNNGIPMTSTLFAGMPGIANLICEVSSFQAECLQYFSPRSVLWTNFDEDHIDRHGSLEAYFRAKFHLIEQQEDHELLLGSAEKNSKEASLLDARRICVVGESVAAAARRFGIRLPDYVQIATRDEVRESVPVGSIFETFPQMENYAVAKRYWIANGFPLKELEDAAVIFAPKAHRLAKTAVFENSGTSIEFWNDSKGTNFHAVYAALESFPQLPVFWIGGGLGKGGDIVEFARRIAPKIQAAHLIGETAPILHKTLAEQDIPATSFDSFPVAINTAFKAAKQSRSPRVIILFSPGFASFDMFKSYADRGSQFEQIVENILAQERRTS